jgi:hypothetical protein
MFEDELPQNFSSIEQSSLPQKVGSGSMLIFRGRATTFFDGVVFLGDHVVEGVGLLAACMASRCVLVLWDDASQIAFPRQPKQAFALCFDVIAIEESISVPGNDGTKSGLALDQRQMTQVLAVSPQLIEGVEARLTLAKQQVAELRFAAAIEAHDLAIQIHRLGVEFCRDGMVQHRKRPELISVAGNQPALATLDLNQ